MFAKLFDRQPRIENNPAHRDGIHRIVARNDHFVRSVRHHDVFAWRKTQYPDFCNARTASRWLTQGIFSMSDRHFDFAYLGTIGRLDFRFKVFLNGRRDVR